MNWNVETRDFAGSFFGLPSVTTSIENFNQEILIDLEVQSLFSSVQVELSKAEFGKIVLKFTEEVQVSPTSKKSLKDLIEEVFTYSVASKKTLSLELVLTKVTSTEITLTPTFN